MAAERAAWPEDSSKRRSAILEGFLGIIRLFPQQTAATRTLAAKFLLRPDSR
jgi:hypothetical protein